MKTNSQLKSVLEVMNLSLSAVVKTFGLVTTTRKRFHLPARSVIAVAILFLSCFHAYSATTRTMVTSGNFSDGTKWSPTGTPVATDILIINPSITCTVDNSSSTNNVLYGTLTIKNGAIVQWQAGGTNILNITTLVGWTTAIGTLNMTNGGTLRIRTSWTATSTYLNFIPGTGTVDINNTSAFSMPATFPNFNNLNVDASSGIAVTLGVTTTLTGNLNINSGMLNAGSYDLNIAGNWTNTAGASGFTYSTRYVTFSGSSQQSITNSAGETFYNLKVNISGGNCLLLNNNVTIKDSLFMLQGTICANSAGTLKIPSALNNYWNASGNYTNGTQLLGTTSNDALRIITDNQQRINVTSAGNVGIGTSTPGAKFEVNGNIKITDGTQGANKVLASDANGLASWQSTGSLVGPTGPVGPTGAQGIQGITGPVGVTGAQGVPGITGSAGATGAQGIQGITGPIGPTGADGSRNAWGLSGNTGTNNSINFIGTIDCVGLNIKTNNETRINITEDGNVGIGTTNFFKTGTDSLFFKLAVNGNIRAKKVIVETNWSDFVFEKNYKLMSINELEKYINTNKHLPGVPSANEVKNNGIDVGSMNAILLQKIEELNLYIIELKKENDELNKRVNNLENK